MTAELGALIECLQGYAHVLVTGPPRSGTRIAATILAHELDYRLFEEDAVDIDSLWKLFGLYSEHRNIVVQAPALSAYCHLVPDAVVFMKRPLEEIRESAARVGIPEQKDQARYLRDDLPSVELAYQAWDRFQRDWFGVEGYELNYSALEGHPLWVAADKRRTFAWDQTRVGEAGGK